MVDIATTFQTRQQAQALSSSLSRFDHGVQVLLRLEEQSRVRQRKTGKSPTRRQQTQRVGDAAIVAKEIESLQNECAELKEELHDLAQHSQPLSLQPGDLLDTTPQLARARLTALLCELEERQHTGAHVDVSTLSVNARVPEVHEELKTRLSEVDAGLVFQRQFLHQQDVLLGRARDILWDRQQLHKTLTDMLQNVPQRQSAKSKRMIESIEKDIGKLKSANGVLMVQFGKFLEQAYPPILPEHLKQRKRKGKKKTAAADDDDEDDGSEVLQLSQMLEKLMNLSVSSPENPYITLSPHTVYEPYVELLIRAGIAVKHPKDSNLLRLVTFHR